MSKLDKLFDTLGAIEMNRNMAYQAVVANIRAELEPKYNDWFSLQNARKRLEEYTGVQYMVDPYGDIQAWVRFDEISDIPEREREYFRDYMLEHSILVDLENETLHTSLGPDCLIVQDDTRSDDGVWQENKLIIDADEYVIDGVEDLGKRNELIEAYMERTGYFPGVFRVTRDGSAYLIDTSSK